MNTSKDFSSFLVPDKFWEDIGIKTLSSFVEKYIVEGKFHENVPQIIKDSYDIVERLQFYSYYKYSFIDEAFAKSTRIFETSIDLRIKELKIEKKGYESLNSKIQRLQKFTSNELFQLWNEAREMRNFFAHEKGGGVVGILLIKALKHNINMINSIFLTQEQILTKENSFKGISKKSSHLKKGLYLFEFEEKKYLIWSMLPYTSSIIDCNSTKSFWVFHPLYANNEIKEISDFPDPFMLNLTNIQITSNSLTATIIGTNKRITVNSTTHPDHVFYLNYHKYQMLNIDLYLKKKYWIFLKSRINKGVIKFLYQDWQ